MICTCGAETRYSAHEVKTLDKAKEWYKDENLTLLDVPLTVRKDTCPGCGRIEMHQHTRN